jgi:serine/threonine protein kinase
MELCQFTLENWIHARNHLYAQKAECQKIRSREALQIFSQILEGLRYIHKKKYIHRDIKPQNIYWKANEEEWDDVEAPDASVLEVIGNISGEWKIGDFGLVANELDCRSPIPVTKNIITPWHNASEYIEQDQTFGVGTMMVQPFFNLN